MMGYLALVVTYFLLASLQNKYFFNLYILPNS